MKPQIFPQGTYSEETIDELKKKASKTIDHIEIWVKNLFDVLHPEYLYAPERPALEKTFLEKCFSEAGNKDLYGTWIWYEEEVLLMHTLNENDFRTVLVARNQDVVTKEELTSLQGKKIAIVGQSVGGNVALAAAHAGFTDFRLADFDTLEPTNLNRVLFANATDIGSQKVDIITAELYRINPFINVEVWPKGVSVDTIQEFLAGVDIIVELCDDFPMKIQIRSESRKHKIPVLMVTSLGRWLLVDVERYDLDQKLPLFNGHVEENILVDIMEGKLGPDDAKRYARDLVGAQSIDPRALNTLKKIGAPEGVTGRPQIISTVSINAGITVQCIMWIFGCFSEDGELKSGRKLLQIDKLIQ